MQQASLHPTRRCRRPPPSVRFQGHTRHGAGSGGLLVPSALTLFRQIGILVDADDFLFFSVAAVSRGFFLPINHTRRVREWQV